MIYVEVSNVSKSFSPDKRALDGISLSIEAGECFGVLGPNGAGKTTLIKIMSTQLVPTKGQVAVLGHNTQSEKQKIRPLMNIINGGDNGHYPWLNAIESIEYFCHLYQVKRPDLKMYVEELLKKVKLPSEAWKRPVSTYSKGMKQRLHIARGLVNDPKVLFLDEPTLGLDIEAVHDTRQLIKELKQKNTSIVLTSHNMSDIEHCCDRLTIIDHGQQKAVFKMSELTEQYKTLVRLDIDNISDTAIRKLQTFCDIIEERDYSCSNGKGRSLTIVLPSDGMSNLHQTILEDGALLRNFNAEHQSLEQVYLRILNQVSV